MSVSHSIFKTEPPYPSDYFAYAESDITETTISDGIEVLLGSVCRFCEHPTIVRLPSTLREIDDYAFEGCIRQRETTLPAGL